jgi:hypothetical protein
LFSSTTAAAMNRSEFLPIEWHNLRSPVRGRSKNSANTSQD